MYQDEILPFATAWVDLKSITLREITQDRKGQEPYDIIYMRDIKQTQQTLLLITQLAA